eukprot:TRINITY_DN353_c0_g1_i6.p1 TRINITY_DN353_c0_g1~~TRINITY_DN353_c0_g1_i6.p1  ORF type:complete len:215 (-),score=33.77 TRINITY_DN353_c0_g1_i6:466-1110(-)
MRKIIGSRLPSFTEDESKQLKGSLDFIGLNHYTVFYVQGLVNVFDNSESDYFRDMSAKWSFQNGLLGEKDFIGLKAPIMPAVPWGMQKMLEYIKLYYNNPAVMIHENGLGEMNWNFSKPSETDDDDVERADYLHQYTQSLLLSIRNGSNVKGYFVWSFVDCWEFLFGYTVQYGLYRVDFSDSGLRRYPRLSAQWYSRFLKSESEVKWNIQLLVY